MPQNFCKLFHAEDVGQVLVLLEGDEDGDAAVHVKFKLASMGAMAGLVTSFHGTEGNRPEGMSEDEWGWELAERAFNNIDEETALGMARKTISDFEEWSNAPVGGHA